MARRLNERERDRRDLRILDLLGAGVTLQVVCDSLGVARGPLTRMLKEIREDRIANGEAP